MQLVRNFVTLFRNHNCESPTLVQHQSSTTHQRRIPPRVSIALVARIFFVTLWSGGWVGGCVVAFYTSASEVARLLHGSD
eukprot:5480835-Amphidinium_carterae.1